MWKYKKKLSTVFAFFLLMVDTLPAYAQNPPEILLPGNNDIISYLPYKLVWAYPDSFRIYQQYIRISQDPFGDIIHLQRILTGRERDYILRSGLADNKAYYLFVGSLTEPDTSILWSIPVSFTLDHLNSPPGEFFIHDIPDTLTPGTPLRWTSSADPDPLDTLLRYIIFTEDTEDSSLQQEILHIPENASLQEHSADITPTLINHKTYRVRIFAEDLEGILQEGIPSQTFVYNTGKNKAPVSPKGLKPFDITELSPGDRLRWDNVYDADGDRVFYSVQMDTTPIFTQPFEFTTLTPFYLINDSLKNYFSDDNRIFWRVRAQDLWGGFSSWSTFGSFYINFENTAPYWTSPFLPEETHHIVTHESFILQWPDAEDDDYSDKDSMTYHIWYRSKEDPERYHFKEKSARHTVPVETLKENGTYHYFIKAEDAAGHFSKQSIRGIITLNRIEEPPYIPPRIVYPPDNQILLPSGRLAWHISEDHDPLDTLKYILTISEDSLFRKNILREILTKSRLPVHAHLLAGFNRWDPMQTLFYTPNPDTMLVQLNYLSFWHRLRDNQRYYFRVQAVDTKQLRSDISETGTFILNKKNNPPEPVAEIYFPCHRCNIHTTNPLFHWKASDDPDPDGDTGTTRYQLNIRDVDKNTIEYILTEPGESQIKPAYPFRENGRYELKIRSFDAKSAFSEWTDPVYFWINEKPELPVLNPDAFSIQADSIITKSNPVFHFGSVCSPDPPEEQIKLFMDIRFIFPASEDTILFPLLPFQSQFNNSDLSFPENTRGIYQVRLRTEDSLMGHWTKAIPFGVDMYADIPLPFYLLHPKAGQDTVKVNPKFKWTACIDPDLNDEITYTLYISPDSTFYEDTYIIRDIKETQYKFDDYDLEDNTKYFWKVSAEDKNGHIVWGSNSNFESRYFIVGLLEAADRDGRGGQGHEFHPVQPNPFKDIVHLKFTLGQSEEVTISIYNIIGQRIEIIHHGVFAAGTHSIKWDITQAGVPLPAGVYIFTLRIGNRVLQQKGLYIK